MIVKWRSAGPRVNALFICMQDHVASGGKAWDTVKPLGKWFQDLRRVVLVDDDAFKVCQPCPCALRMQCIVRVNLAASHAAGGSRPCTYAEERSCCMHAGAAGRGGQHGAGAALG
jgi:hypothetical protein